MTRSLNCDSVWIAVERIVPATGAGCEAWDGGQGKSALSRPMREDAPAARMTPHSPKLMEKLFRRVPAQKLAQAAPRTAHPNIELAELRVHRADFIEAHFVDHLLEDQGIVCKKIYAPFPVVETDRAGDDLFHLAGVTAAHQAVLVHLARALLDRQRVPILVLAAAAVHGIEADVTRIGNLREQARPHGFALAGQRLRNRLLPLIRVRLNSALSEFPVSFQAGLV